MIKCKGVNVIGIEAPHENNMCLHDNRYRNTEVLPIKGATNTLKQLCKLLVQKDEQL
jgi:hypothetical protein